MIVVVFCCDVFLMLKLMCVRLYVLIIVWYVFFSVGIVEYVCISGVLFVLLNDMVILLFFV